MKERKAQLITSTDLSSANLLAPKVLSAKDATDIFRDGYTLTPKMFELAQLQLPDQARKVEARRTQSIIQGGVTQHDLLAIKNKEIAALVMTRKKYIDETFWSAIACTHPGFPVERFKHTSVHFKLLVSDHKAKDQLPHYDAMKQALVLAIYLKKTHSTKVSLFGHAAPPEPDDQEHTCRWWFGRGFDSPMSYFNVEGGDCLAFLTTHLHAGFVVVFVVFLLIQSAFVYKQARCIPTRTTTEKFIFWHIP